MELSGARRRLAAQPWPTFVLLAAITAVFCCEIVFGLDEWTGPLQPSVRTLVTMGGLNRDLMAGSGEWYRLVTAPFLHGSLIHLLLNGFVLLWIGPIAENVLGRAWFVAVYAVSAVTGVLMSIALSPASVVSVGASGALMGLLGCLFVASFHFVHGVMRSQLQSVALRVLLPSLIPLATPVGGLHVDYGAHLGGVMGGALVGMVLLQNWPEKERRPRLRGLAAAVAAVGLAATVATLVPVTRSIIKVRREGDLRAMLIPNSQLPRTDAEMKQQVENLAARYPHDPRPRLYHGMTMLDAGNLAGAERELRQGLADAEMLKDFLLPRTEQMLRTNLAMALYGSRKADEARTIAAPVCKLGTAEIRPMRRSLRSIGICE